jgi:hypothetical protein
VIIVGELFANVYRIELFQSFDADDSAKFPPSGLRSVCVTSRFAHATGVETVDVLFTAFESGGAVSVAVLLSVTLHAANVIVPVIVTVALSPTGIDAPEHVITFPAPTTQANGVAAPVVAVFAALVIV